MCDSRGMMCKSEGCDVWGVMCEGVMCEGCNSHGTHTERIRVSRNW